MKICIFTNHFYPEDFKVNDIAFELAKLGYKITVITAIPDYPQGKFYSGYTFIKRRKETINFVSVIRLPIIPRRKGKKIQLILNYLSYFISSSVFTFFHSFRYKYDAVFVHLTSPFFIGLPAVFLKKQQKIPLLFWTLDLWPESVTAAGDITNKILLSSLTKMVTYVYNNCDKILIGSKGFAQSICEKGSFKEKIEYFPNWAECESTENTLSVTCPENTVFDQFTEDDFIFLFAGNIGEAQNIGFIIDTLTEMNLPSRIKFVFLGDGRARENLINLTKRQNLEQMVYFPGRYPLETMPFFMKRANVLIVSLKDELIFNVTVPSKMQYYMAQEKPILAILNGEGAELTRKAQCGFAVSPNDKDYLKKEIIKLIHCSPLELSTMGQNGKKYYESHFKKQDRINQLVQFFSESNECLIRLATKVNLT